MARPQLRIYYGPNDDRAVTAEPLQHQRQTVTVPLGDIFPLLADALSSGKTWVHDFGDDEITISNDLYEVMLAYQHFRRPSA